MTARRALISVYDKTGIADLARELVSLGWEILSSSGTRHPGGRGSWKTADVTGSRPYRWSVKTSPEDIGESSLEGTRRGTWRTWRPGIPSGGGVQPHPSRRRPESILPGCSAGQLSSEQVLLRAAKNFRRVIVLPSPEEYERVIEELEGEETFPADEKRQL